VTMTGLGGCDLVFLGYLLLNAELSNVMVYVYLGASVDMLLSRWHFKVPHDTPSISSNCKPQLCKRHILTNSTIDATIKRLDCSPSIGRIKILPVSN
jgi:hypothetical protein